MAVRKMLPAMLFRDEVEFQVEQTWTTYGRQIGDRLYLPMGLEVRPESTDLIRIKGRLHVVLASQRLEDAYLLHVMQVDEWETADTDPLPFRRTMAYERFASREAAPSDITVVYDPRDRW